MVDSELHTSFDCVGLLGISALMCKAARSGLRGSSSFVCVSSVARTRPFSLFSRDRQRTYSTMQTNTATAGDAAAGPTAEDIQDVQNKLRKIKDEISELTRSLGLPKEVLVSEILNFLR